MDDRFFLDQDSSGHWFVVPVAHTKEWDKWSSLPEEDERAWDAPEWAQPVGGSYRLVTFTKPKIE